jgi:hypothetical protein
MAWRNPSGEVVSDIQTANTKWTPLNRVLLGVVIFMGVLIVLALLALVYGAIAGWTKHSTTPPQPESTASASGSLHHLPPGASIVEMKVDNGRTILRLKTKQGEEVDIYDSESGALVARIAPEGQ